MVNLIGIDKAELLAALFNYAKDMKESKKIMPTHLLEDTQIYLLVSSNEIIAGKTDETTSDKRQEIKKIMKAILDAKRKNEYLTPTTAQIIINANPNIKEVNGIPIFINLKGNDIDTCKFNSLYGQWAAESIANIFKDEISYDSTGKIKKPKKVK